jgi:hypothetical protein
MHQDHFDYLVGESLHHVEHGACEHHGSLQLSSPKKARTAQQPIVRRNANMMRLYQSDESELETIALKPTPPRSKFINEADRHWFVSSFN